MPKQPDDDVVQKFANAAFLVIVSRVSAPLMVTLTLWALHTLNTMQTDVSALTASVQGKFETLTAKIEGVDKRENDLESWRNGMEAFAGENYQKKPNGGL